MSAGWAGKPVISAKERRRLARERLARLERRRRMELEEQAKRAGRRRAVETADSRRRLESLMNIRNEAMKEAFPGSGPVDWDEEPESRQMKEMAALMRRRLSGIPDDLRQVLGVGLSVIEETLEAVERQGYDPYLRPRLIAAEREQSEMLADAQHRLTEWVGRLRHARAREDMTISRLRVVQSENGGRSSEAAGLISALDALDEIADPAAIEARLGPLESAAERVIEAHEEEVARAAERTYIETSFREVITEMGYRVLDLPESYRPADDDDADIQYYLTPEGEALRVETTGDAEVRWRVMRVVTEGSDEESATHGEMVKVAKAHCHRAEGFLSDGLGAMGIRLVESEDQPPEDEHFVALVLPEGRVGTMEPAGRVRERGAGREEK